MGLSEHTRNGQKEQPDSEQQVLGYTKCYPTWDLNQELGAVENGQTIRPAKLTLIMTCYPILFTCGHVVLKRNFLSDIII